MADKVKAAGRQPPEELAFQLWLEAGRPPLRDFEGMLKKMGYIVSFATLSRWKDKNPTWLADFNQMISPVSTTKVIAALKAAKDDATELEPGHFVGVKAQLIARLYETIKVMQINTIEEWHKALDACDRIQALIHAERGKAVADADNAAIPRGATPSLISRLDPPVTLAAFKMPGAN